MKIVNISYINGDSFKLDNVNSLNYDQSTNCWFLNLNSGALVMIGRELIRLMHIAELPAVEAPAVEENVEENTTNNEDI